MLSDEMREHAPDCRRYDHDRLFAIGAQLSFVCTILRSSCSASELSMTRPSSPLWRAMEISICSRSRLQSHRHWQRLIERGHLLDQQSGKRRAKCLGGFGHNKISRRQAGQGLENAAQIADWNALLEAVGAECRSAYAAAPALAPLTRPDLVRLRQIVEQSLNIILTDQLTGIFMQHLREMRAMTDSGSTTT